MTLSATQISQTGLAGNGGPTVRVGTVAPTAATPANDGDMYHDVVAGLLYGPRTAGAWDLSHATPTRGAQGPQGPIVYVPPPDVGQAVGLSCGPSVGMTSSYAATTSAVPLNALGTLVSGDYPSDLASALMGAAFTNYGTPQNVAGTFSLLDLTAGSTLYTSASIGGGTYAAVGPFTATQYPMPAGHVFRWVFKAASSAQVYTSCVPTYLTTSQQGFCVTTQPTVAVTTLSGASQVMNVPGTTLNLPFNNARPAWLYSGVLRNQSSAQASFSFGSVYSAQVPAYTDQPFGPFSPAQGYIAPSTQTFWRVTGTGSGPVFAEYQMAMTA